MKRLFISAVIVFLFLRPSASFCAAQAESEEKNEPEPYEEAEFPQWAKDVRRLEIVSLGSVPFAALTVTLGYGAYLYYSGSSDSFPNPFDKNSAFSEGDQMKLFCISLGAGAAIGLADLAVNLIKRHTEKKRLEKIKASQDQILVIPLHSSPDEEQQEEIPEPEL